MIWANENTLFKQAPLVTAEHTGDNVVGKFRREFRSKRIKRYKRRIQKDETKQMPVFFLIQADVRRKPLRRDMKTFRTPNCDSKLFAYKTNLGPNVASLPTVKSRVTDNLD